MTSFDGREVASYPSRQRFIDTDGTEDGVNLSFHLAGAGPSDSVAGRAYEVPIVIAIRLRCQKATHTLCTDQRAPTEQGRDAPC